MCSEASKRDCDYYWMMHVTEAQLEATIYKRNEAQEAAETYHEAWQDAGVYWKTSRDEARQKAIQFWGTVKMYVRHQNLGGRGQCEEWITEQETQNPWLKANYNE
jgi:hypothetical protein